MIECLEQLKFYITNYYKDPFGTSEEGNFFLDESKTDDIPQDFDKENSFLIAPYSEDEVRKTDFF
jgi:hypothetical protein